MKTFLISLIAILVSYTNTELTEFDNSNYVEDELVIEMLASHFVKDLNSEDLKTHVGEYLQNHMDNVSHVSAHYAAEGDTYFYAVFGTKDGVAKTEYLAVNKMHFQAGTYFDFNEPLNLIPTCRKGNGHPVTCPTWCDNWPIGCLGIHCEPYEC